MIDNRHDQPMTRMQAESLALTRGRLDRQNNYVAKLNCNGTWRVDSFPIHMHSCGIITDRRD